MDRTMLIRHLEQTKRTFAPLLLVCVCCFIGCQQEPSAPVQANQKEAVDLSVTNEKQAAIQANEHELTSVPVSSSTHIIMAEEGSELPSNLRQRNRVPQSKPIPVEIFKAFEKLTQPLDSFEEWESANQTFLNFGAETLPLLTEKLQQGNDVERELAASTLVALGEVAEPAIGSLRKALADSLPFVRANAAVALMSFSETRDEAISVLIHFLQHSDQNLSQMAAVNLSMMGGEASQHVVELTSVLEKKTEQPQVLLPVVQLLGQIGAEAEQALPQLRQIAFEKQGEIGDAAYSAIQLIETATSTKNAE